MVSFRSFAIVPAAGHSRRMGVPKLLLRWGTRTVIEQVLAAWQASRVDHVVVVVRSDQQELIRVCRSWHVDLAVAERPPADMKHSVQIGLRQIQRLHRPNADDVFLLAPADMPQLPTDAIDLLLASHNPRSPVILVPVFNQRRGHPVLMPWPLHADIGTLGPREGVNVLLQRYSVRELAVSQPACLEDLDHPADYRPPPIRG